MTERHRDVASDIIGTLHVQLDSKDEAIAKLESELEQMKRTLGQEPVVPARPDALDARQAPRIPMSMFGAQSAEAAELVQAARERATSAHNATTPSEVLQSVRVSPTANAPVPPRPGVTQPSAQPDTAVQPGIAGLPQRPEQDTVQAVPVPEMPLSAAFPLSVEPLPARSPAAPDDTPTVRTPESRLVPPVVVTLTSRPEPLASALPYGRVAPDPPVKVSPSQAEVPLAVPVVPVVSAISNVPAQPPAQAMPRIPVRTVPAPARHRSALPLALGTLAAAAVVGALLIANPRTLPDAPAQTTQGAIRVASSNMGTTTPARSVVVSAPEAQAPANTNTVQAERNPVSAAPAAGGSALGAPVPPVVRTRRDLPGPSIGPDRSQAVAPGDVQSNVQAEPAPRLRTPAPAVLPVTSPEPQTASGAVVHYRMHRHQRPLTVTGNGALDAQYRPARVPADASPEPANAAPPDVVYHAGEPAQPADTTSLAQPSTEPDVVYHSGNPDDSTSTSSQAVISRSPYPTSYHPARPRRYHRRSQAGRVPPRRPAQAPSAGNDENADAWLDRMP